MNDLKTDMMNSGKIFVIGSSNTDMVVKSKKLPAPGETIIGGSFLMNAGGKGANQAVAAARLGGNVTLIAKVGDDIFGSQSILSLKNENINTDFIFVDHGTASGTALIMVNMEGENCIVVASGANANLLPNDIKRVNNLTEAEIIVMQLEIPLKTVEFLATWAKANHKKVIINPAPAHALNTGLLDGLFLITPNETEATLLTGINVKDEFSASKAAQVFLDKGVQHVIITLGKQGAYFQDNHTRFMVSAPPVDTKDTTGAGDTFNGAIAVAITEGRDWEDSVRFAVEAAAVSVTRMGAQASIPYRNEVEMRAGIRIYQS